MTTVHLDPPGSARASASNGLDAVLALEPGVSGKASRNVPSTLPVLATHFPRFPVLPGVLILDDLARLAALVMNRDEPERWSLGGASRIRYRRYVRPGDVAELDVEVSSTEGDPVLRGTVRVDGTLVTSVGALTMRDTAAGGTS